MRRAAAVLAFLAGCNVEVELGQECPLRGAACSPAPLTTVAPESVVSPEPLEPEHAAPPPLQVYIAHRGLPAAQLSVSCDEPCVQLEAVAQGGVPPYSFEWEDGSQYPTRVVCPGVTTAYRVRATDSAAGTELSPELSTNVATCAAPAPPLPDTSASTSLDSVATPSCAPLPLLMPPRELDGGTCAASLWTLLQHPVFKGRIHEMRMRGPGLWEGRWTLELWGSPNGCELSEYLGTFQVERGPVPARLRFLPSLDHNLLVLKVVERVASGPRWPYLGFRLCTAE